MRSVLRRNKPKSVAREVLSSFASPVEPLLLSVAPRPRCLACDSMVSGVPSWNLMAFCRVGERRRAHSFRLSCKSRQEPSVCCEFPVHVVHDHAVDNEEQAW